MAQIAGLILGVISLSAPMIACSPTLKKSSSENNLPLPKFHFWIRRSLTIARNVSCGAIDWPSRNQCRQMKRQKDSEFTVYAAEPAKNGQKIFMTLPDRSLDHSGEHDGIVVIDPFHGGSFGHLVFVFVVDESTDGVSCHLSGGNYSAFRQTCFLEAKRDGCYRNPHIIRRRHSRHETRKCDINFLPSVFGASNSVEASFSNGDGNQLLQCRNLPGFAPCPRLRHKTVTSRQACHTPTCLRRFERELEMRCRLFEICDHAVLIQSGWNQLVSRRSDFDLLRQTEQFLYRNHFPKSNVKLFYSNGEPDSPVKKNTEGKIYPASSKSLMRDYINSICSESCVETLVVVLRGPVLENGNILLWDANKNEIAEADEIYLVKEILEDLADCNAHQVVLILDHSYGGFLQANLNWDLKGHQDMYKNLQILSSTDLTEFEKNGAFLRYFIERNHKNKCTMQIYEDAIKAGLLSQDHSHHPSQLKPRTVFGAPCGVQPPFTDLELREKYLGCQNVPTFQWFQFASSVRQRKKFNNSDYQENSISQKTSRHVLMERNS